MHSRGAFHGFKCHRIRTSKCPKLEKAQNRQQNLKPNTLPLKHTRKRARYSTRRNKDADHRKTQDMPMAVTWRRKSWGPKGLVKWSATLSAVGTKCKVRICLATVERMLWIARSMCLVLAELAVLSAIAMAERLSQCSTSPPAHPRSARRRRSQVPSRAA